MQQTRVVIEPAVWSMPTVSLQAVSVHVVKVTGHAFEEATTGTTTCARARWLLLDMLEIMALTH